MTPAPPATVRAFDDVSGAPRTSEEKIHAWLKRRNANADAHAMVKAIHAARAAYPASAPAPDFLSAEFCLETGFATWGGGAKRWNPAGIKTATATGDAPSDFEVPPTPEAGAHLFYNHWAALIGYDPVPPVHGRYAVAKAVYRTKGLYGRVKKIGQLGGGVWAADPRYGSSILALLRDLEGGGPPVGEDRGVAFLRSLGRVPYDPWRPGNDRVMWADRIPSPAEAQMVGAVCTAVPNILLQSRGLKPPQYGSYLRGGTGSYGAMFPASKYPFDPTKNYPALTLFVRPYTGEALGNQGHVACSLEAAVNPRLIQSDAFEGVPNPGLNTKRTLLETHHLEAFAAAVPPSVWLKGAS